MSAPERFVAWMVEHKPTDKWGHAYYYHPRSDAHSKALCRFILEDLLTTCGPLREQAAQGEVAYGINVTHAWPDGKEKTHDLAIGRPAEAHREASEVPGIGRAERFREILLACEAKSAMTEHAKAQPRIFDELSSSHEIVHKGRAAAIAAGVTVVNIADTFVSPTRNQRKGRRLTVTRHRQPHVAERMVRHLRGLRIREAIGEVGFEAYCTIVIDCDNQTGVRLWTDPPAPQSGEQDHYQTFLDRLTKFYTERFSRLT